ncbi:MAG: efflux RND transporter periplasmic adaptor subunit [Planctomycetaceae bacterium]|jgi:RND family efflux transporter MFP subunit|nr:efflux RND transporter periplasmic adaptor subunit [Planctomycetaceae bacterium]
MKTTAFVPAYFLVFALVIGCGKKPQVAEVPLPVVSAEEAATAEIQPFIYESAYSEAYEFVKITARVKGFLREINYKPGEIIPADKQLFLIEPDQYKAAVASAEAQVVYAEAQYKSAQADYERTKQLVSQGAETQQDLDKGTAARDEAAASILKAKAGLESEKINLSYTVVKSPITGKVDRNLIDIGNVVGSNDDNSQLTAVARMSPIYIYFTISDSNFNLIRENTLNDKNAKNAEPKTLQDCDIPFSIGIIKGAGVETTDYPFTGKLDMVSNTIDRSTGTIQVRGVVPNEDFAIFPGQICRVRIPAGAKKEQVVIKQEAVRRDLNKTYIFIVDADNTAHKRYVELGAEQSDGTRVVIKGLQKGERYIVNGAAKARDGKKVSNKF